MFIPSGQLTLQLNAEFLGILLRPIQIVSLVFVLVNAYLYDSASHEIFVSGCEPAILCLAFIRHEGVTDPVILGCGW
jgi:hypothetical protein